MMFEHRGITPVIRPDAWISPAAVISGAVIIG